MEKKTIGSFISVLRKASGMTQQEMADKLNISNKAISRWERDECSPDVTLIPVIAEMFGVSCDELLKGERITNNSDTEKSSLKIEKQTRRLLNNTISRFKSAIYIAVAGSFIGFVLLFAFSYGYYKPVFGFAILLIFVMASAILTFLSLNRLNSQTKDNELFDNLIESDVSHLRQIKYRYTFVSFFINMIVILWGLPFLNIFDNEYINILLTYNHNFIMYTNGVITFRYYFLLVPLLVLLSLIILLITNKIGIHYFFGEKHIFTKDFILLDVYQILCPFLIIALIYLLVFLKVNLSGNIMLLLYILIFFSFIFPAAYFLIRYKKIRKLMMIMVIRNSCMWSAVFIFSKGIIWYKAHTELYGTILNNHWAMTLNYYYVIPAIIFSDVVIIGYILLKKYWVKK